MTGHSWQDSLNEKEREEMLGLLAGEDTKPIAKITEIGSGFEIDAAKLSRAGPPALSSWPPGFISKFVEWASKGTDAPDEFLVCSALHAAATAAGHGSLRLKFGADPIYTNMWMLLIAPSGFFRKTTSINRAKGVIQAACPDRIMPDRLTPESFYESLSLNSEGVFTISEFGAFMGAMSRNYMSGFQADITELYDCPRVFTRQRKDKKGELKLFTINRPIIGIFAGSTIDWLAEILKESDAGSGFLPRFLFCTVNERKKPIMIVPQEIEHAPAGLVNILNWVAGMHGDVEFNSSSPGYEVYESFFNYLINELDECKEGKSVMGGFVTRLQVYALKIALTLEAVSAAAKGLSEIKTLSEESVTWGTYFAQWFYMNLRWLLANELTFGEHDRERGKVLKHLREAGGAMPHSNLMRSMHMKQRQFTELMETLIGTGDVIETEGQQLGKAGRPGKKYLLAEVVKTAKLKPIRVMKREEEIDTRRMPNLGQPWNEDYIPEGDD